MTALIAEEQREQHVLEGSAVFCEGLREHFPQVTVHNCLFEDFTPDAPYDAIVLGHVLEHVVDPVAVTRLVRSWLAPGGKVFAAVPNSRSLHRQAAVIMGLLPQEDAMSELDHRHGHQRVFNPESFRACFTQADLEIEVFGGYSIKPQSNAQIDRDWTPEMLDAFLKLGVGAIPMWPRRLRGRQGVLTARRFRAASDPLPPHEHGCPAGARHITEQVFAPVVDLGRLRVPRRTGRSRECNRPDRSNATRTREASHQPSTDTEYPRSSAEDRARVTDPPVGTPAGGTVVRHYRAPAVHTDEELVAFPVCVLPSHSLVGHIQHHEVAADGNGISRSNSPTESSPRRSLT